MERPAQMRYRFLGSSGIKVSEICLGTMMFGGATDEAQARRIVDQAAESGVNFVDTADVYADGRSEAIVGPAIKEKRDRWVLATKGAQRSGANVTDMGLSRRYLIRAVDASLKRLQTDHIDLYYIHRVDPYTPWEQTIATFGDLIRQGKIREWALSNVRAWHIPHVVHLCRQLERAAAGRLAALLQPDEPPARDRVAAGGEVLQSRRRSLQPAGARRAHRQVQGQPGGRARQRAPPARTRACWKRSGAPKA